MAYRNSYRGNQLFENPYQQTQKVNHSQLIGPFPIHLLQFLLCLLPKQDGVRNREKVYFRNHDRSAIRYHYWLHMLQEITYFLLTTGCQEIGIRKSYRGKKFNNKKFSLQKSKSPANFLNVEHVIENCNLKTAY